MTARDWYVGNAAYDGEQHRGWIVGHFMDGDVRRTEGVEIKWGVHPGGEERADWQGDESRTTVLLLVKGRFGVELSVGSFVLEREGDYAVWGPGIGHSWRAEEDSVVVTVRWPSAPPGAVSDGNTE
jgi:quercetin dioxygenase-like cupin family protein